MRFGKESSHFSRKFVLRWIASLWLRLPTAGALRGLALSAPPVTRRAPLMSGAVAMANRLFRYGLRDFTLRRRVSLHHEAYCWNTEHPTSSAGGAHQFL